MTVAGIDAVGPLAIALFSGVATLLMSLLLPYVVRPLLVRLGIVDVPSARSSHERPVIRGLGLAVLLSIAVGGAVGLFMLRSWAGTDWLALALVLAASAAAGLLGLGEDLKGVSVGVRSVLLLAIALAAGLGLVWYAGAAWWVVVYAVFFVSGYINVANFMDGLNGISGLHGIVAGVAFFAAGWICGVPWLMTMGLILAAAFAGFLPWNLTKPGAFLGDVGSYLLGGATAVTSLFALVSGVPILATIGPMIIYFGDVAVTLVSRVRAGKKWDEPHKEHTYQRLQQSGRSHLWAAGVTAAFSAAASVLGRASIFVPPIWWLAFLVAGLAVLVLYIRLPRMLSARPAAQ